jgi:hypothetical protein
MPTDAGICDPSGKNSVVSLRELTILIFLSVFRFANQRRLPTAVVFFEKPCFIGSEIACQ